MTLCFVVFIGNQILAQIGFRSNLAIHPDEANTGKMIAEVSGYLVAGQYNRKLAFLSLISLGLLDGRRISLLTVLDFKGSSNNFLIDSLGYSIAMDFGEQMENNLTTHWTTSENYRQL